MSAPTYKIDRVWDLLEVPDDRLDECLRELAIGLRAIRNTCDVLREIAKLTGEEESVRFEPGPPFEWIDDNEGRIDINVSVEAEPNNPC